MATPPEKVTLVAADGEKVETTGTAMLQSKFLKDMIGDLRPDEEIPLPNVRAGALKVIVKYCEYHTTVAVAVLKKPLPNKGLEEMVDAYDASVVDVEAHVLLELLTAASYMDVQPLTELCAAKVSNVQ
eukprot:GHVN01018182.1.p1 GENE.GHVN01018182.1~~GHVN01018182.1.p1  ORF type:complete len:128 (+),score=15.25 GHVN01018182.1:208-591(+)